MFGELIRRERKLAVRFAGRRILFPRIVIAVHDELPVHRDHFFFFVVEVDSSSKSASRWLAGLAQHVIRPDNRHVRRRAILTLLQLGFEPSRRIGKRHGLATCACDQQSQNQPAKTSVCLCLSSHRATRCRNWRRQGSGFRVQVGRNQGIRKCKVQNEKCKVQSANWGDRKARVSSFCILHFAFFTLHFSFLQNPKP